MPTFFDRDKIRERLRVLREHRWSSYRAYGNYAAVPEWLVTGELLTRAGGRAIARWRSGLTLSRLGELAGGMAYKAVFAQVKYTERRLDKNATLRTIYQQCQKQL